MKKKIFYILALICCLNLYSSAKQFCTTCTKKCCANKTNVLKKQPVKTKKMAVTNPRPFNFYLFNI